MNENDVKVKKPLLDELLKIDEDLPPMDHDETIEPGPEDLAALLSPVDEKESQEDFEEKSGRDTDFSEFGAVDEPEDASWIEDRGEEDKPAVDVSVDFAQDDWAEESESVGLEAENDWFVDENDGYTVEDDGGVEGPVGDANDFEIDPDSWDELEGDSDEEDAEGPFADLDLELAQVEGDGDLDDPQGRIIDGQFLGPMGGGIRAAGFMGGSPVGVGEGLFVLGADGMLHPAVGAQILCEMHATSICSDLEAIFIGTACGGAFATRNRGKSLKQINGWYAQGLRSEDQTSFERVSTSFEILGHKVPYGYRLIGRTGNGQLFVSHDYGRLWRSLATPGNCLGLSAVSDSTDIVALFNVKKIGIGLFRNSDLLAWEQFGLPKPLAAAADGAFHIAAGGETVVLALDGSQVPLFYSLNGGRDWTPAPGIKGVTAVALDPHDPGWMAAAIYDGGADLALIRISEDGGQTWRTVYTIGDGDDEDSSLGENQAGGNRIVSLAVNAGREREVIAVTNRGAHLITLARRGVSH